MDTNSASERRLKKTRIIWILLFIGIIIFILIVYWMVPEHISNAFQFSDSALTILEIVLGVFAIYSLFYVRREKYMLKAYVMKFHDNSKAAGLLSLMRFAMTEAIGIYGLLLGILGAEWYITLPFFIVSGIFMIFYFPTSRKWNRLLEAAEAITISSKEV